MAEFQLVGESDWDSFHLDEAESRKGNSRSQLLIFQIQISNRAQMVVPPTFRVNLVSQFSLEKPSQTHSKAHLTNTLSILNLLKLSMTLDKAETQEGSMAIQGQESRNGVYAIQKGAIGRLKNKNPQVFAYVFSWLAQDGIWKDVAA